MKKDFDMSSVVARAIRAFRRKQEDLLYNALAGKAPYSNFFYFTPIGDVAERLNFCSMLVRGDYNAARKWILDADIELRESIPVKIIEFLGRDCEKKHDKRNK